MSWKFRRIFLALAFFLASHASLLHADNKPPTPVKFAGAKILSLLPYIAIQEGYFKDEGLAVTYNEIQTGKMTMDTILSGAADFGMLVDSNVAFVSFQENPIRVLASIATRLDDAVVYRIDRGITRPADLKGRTVGYLPATSSQIFLARFLKANGLSFSDIKPVILQPTAMQAALTGGVIDAASVWQPYRYNIARALGDRAGEFNNTSEIYPGNMLLATTKTIIEQQPETAKSVLRALLRAEDFASQHEEESIKMLTKFEAVDEPALRAIWHGTKIGIGLNDSTLKLIREISAWIVATQRGFEAKALPNIEPQFAPEILRAIAPERVELK